MTSTEVLIFHWSTLIFLFADIWGKCIFILCSMKFSDGNLRLYNWDHTMRKREKYVVKKQVGMGNKNVNSKKFYLI